MIPEDKTCASCGRRIEWRKKWERDWDQVPYCSTACRRRGVGSLDRELEAAILRMLGPGVLDLGDVIAAVDRPDEAGDLREPARRAARRLVAAGRAEMVQRGRVVDPSTAKGDFGVRRAR